MVFPRILILVQNKYTDISVTNTEHNFTRLEALIDLAVYSTKSQLNTDKPAAAFFSLGSRARSPARIQRKNFRHPSAPAPIAQQLIFRVLDGHNNTFSIYARIDADIRMRTPLAG